MRTAETLRLELAEQHERDLRQLEDALRAELSDALTQLKVCVRACVRCACVCVICSLGVRCCAVCLRVCDVRVWCVGLKHLQLEGAPREELCDAH